MERIVVVDGNMVETCVVPWSQAAQQSPQNPSHHSSFMAFYGLQFNRNEHQISWRSAIFLQSPLQSPGLSFQLERSDGPVRQSDCFASMGSPASLDAAGQRVFFCSQLHCIDHHGILPRKSSSTKVCLSRPIPGWSWEALRVAPPWQRNKSWSIVSTLQWSRLTPSWVIMDLCGYGTQRRGGGIWDQMAFFLLFDRFRTNIRRAGLQSCILPIQATSTVALNMLHSMAEKQIIPLPQVIYIPGCCSRGRWSPTWASHDMESLSPWRCRFWRWLALSSGRASGYYPLCYWDKGWTGWRLGPQGATYSSLRLCSAWPFCIWQILPVVHEEVAPCTHGPRGRPSHNDQSWI